MRKTLRTARSSAALALLIAATVTVAAQSGGIASLTVRTPDARIFDVALNELWVDARDGDVSLAALLSTPGVRSARRDGRLLVATVENALAPHDLVSIGRAVQQRLPAATWLIALYDPGAPHTAEHRALLTRKVIVRLAAGASPSLVLGDSLPWTPFAPVPGAYVVEAEDPLQAVALSDTLASRAGVRMAYPLLLRTEFPR